jgi:hypothetical protein
LTCGTEHSFLHTRASKFVCMCEAHETQKLGYLSIMQIAITHMICRMNEWEHSFLNLHVSHAIKILILSLTQLCVCIRNVQVCSTVCVVSSLLHLHYSSQYHLMYTYILENCILKEETESGFMMLYTIVCHSGLLKKYYSFFSILQKHSHRT